MYDTYVMYIITYTHIKWCLLMHAKMTTSAWLLQFLGTYIVQVGSLNSKIQWSFINPSYFHLAS